MAFDTLEGWDRVVSADKCIEVNCRETAFRSSIETWAIASRFIIVGVVHWRDGADDEGLA